KGRAIRESVRDGSARRAGAALGLQNRRRTRSAPWAGSIPVRFRMQDDLRRLPSVSAVLARESVVALVATHGLPLVTRAVRDVIERARRALLRGEPAGSIDADAIEREVRAISQSSLARV